MKQQRGWPSWRTITVLLAFTMIAAACGDDSSSSGDAATADEPAADEPAADEPAADEPAADEPAADEPAADEPAADEPAADEPADDAMAELSPVPGFDGETIKVGVINDASGPVAIIGIPLQNGGRAYYESVNARGGIGGQYPIELVEVDSMYNPTTAVQVYNEIKDDVVIIGNLLGTPIVSAVLESLEQDGLVAAPASLDGTWVHEPNLLPIGGPYQVQAINGLDWYINEGGGATDDVLCTFIQDDPYGEAGQAGAEFAAEKLGMTISETARYVSGDTDYSAPVQQLQGAGCEVVWLTATPTPMGAALGVAAQSGYEPTWLGQSPVWVGVLGASALAPYLQANLVVVSDGATWGDESVPGMVEMIADLEVHTPDQDPDVYFIFGYAQALAVVEVLEQAVANGDLSHDGILKAVTEIGTLDFGGLFGPYEYGVEGERRAATQSTIFRVNPDVPGGLEAVAMHESPFAADFDFS